MGARPPGSAPHTRRVALPGLRPPPPATDGTAKLTVFFCRSTSLDESLAEAVVHGPLGNPVGASHTNRGANSRVHHSVNGHLGRTQARGALCHGQDPDLFERRPAPAHLPTPSFPGREHCLPSFPTTAPGRAPPVRSSSRHHVGASCFTTDTSVFRVEPGSS